jgi:hypothetical protein
MVRLLASLLNALSCARPTRNSSGSQLARDLCHVTTLIAGTIQLDL